MADKKLIATTVSSHEKGLKRREEGKTTSSQRKTPTQDNQDESKRNQEKPNDESPTRRRNRKYDIDEEAIRMEDMRSKGGGRLKHCTVDGDVPLCLRGKLKDNKETSSSESEKYEGKGSRSSNQSKMKKCVMNNMASGSKELPPRSTEGKIRTQKIRKSPSSFFKKHEVYALK